MFVGVYIMRTSTLKDIKKEEKGTWRMPWLLEAKKDVISCDKPC